MGAPAGNKNSSKDNRLWSGTIRRAVIQDKAKRLRKAAESLLDAAAAGDIEAMKVLGDRLDGKPHQTIAAEVDTNVTVEVVRFGKGKASK
jgi:hypothetical protein